MSTLDLETELELDLGLDEADDDAHLRARVGAMLTVDPRRLPKIEVRKRAIDARRGRVRFHLTIGFVEATGTPVLGAPDPREVSGSPVVIVGAGPAGLWCAYQLAREGVASIVLDRGKDVQARRRDLKGLTQHGRVDPDSNYCFGEGGAGTYSDGKLYTRAHKRGDVRDVLEILVRNGAPPEILVDARPHIGSNRLPKLVAAVRDRLVACGVELRFGARVTRLTTAGGQVTGVELADGSAIAAREVVIATGHSARDVFELLASAGVTLEPKAFAMGVRVEHPQPLIDQVQYGKSAGHPKLRAAPYRVSAQVEGRGVFSFCMCPGGWIVPAATEPDGVVVNGMSLSRRDSPYANSGLVVAVEVEDVARVKLAGVEVQRRLERAAAIAGGGDLRAPATRVTDFLAGRASSTVPASSYEPGLLAGDVAGVLDAACLPLAGKLREALRAFERQLRGFVTDEAVLVGVESRTSSPLRVPRDPSTLASPDLRGLYPSGEGAGYAGGIVSAALDGVRVARAILAARRTGS